MASTPEGLLDEWVEALLAHDPVRVAACYADDPPLYIPSAGVDARGRSQVHDALAATFAGGIRPTEFTVHERSIVNDGAHSYALLRTPQCAVRGGLWPGSRYRPRPSDRGDATGRGRHVVGRHRSRLGVKVTGLHPRSWLLREGSVDGVHRSWPCGSPTLSRSRCR